MANFLESLVAEWYQYNGYFVRQNVNVGRRATGGYDTELDVVAFSPKRKEILHIETSTDADAWSRREERYSTKYEAGRKHIPEILGLDNLNGYDLKQIALFVFASNAHVPTIGSGEVQSVDEFMKQVKSVLGSKKVAKAVVPEQFPLLRAVQFTVQFGK